ncbi:hypothetical protein [Clostridium cadaveris]|uniref:hypothetical protein n=1 Tax=Clostridium cadaveris TaxID=1529 RepID=UPI0031D3C0DF
MGMGLGDIFKAIVEELGEDALGSATQMLFDKKKDKFPIPIKKPFWEEGKSEPEVKPNRKIQNQNKKNKKSVENDNKAETSNKNETKNNEKSLEAQLSKLKEKESSYEYLESIDKEELKRGIIMSEILGKPRCKQRIRKRF